jgi:hypothetical protein
LATSLLLLLLLGIGHLRCLLCVALLDGLWHCWIAVTLPRLSLFALPCIYRPQETHIARRGTAVVLCTEDEGGSSGSSDLFLLARRQVRRHICLHAARVVSSLGHRPTLLQQLAGATPGMPRHLVQIVVRSGSLQRWRCCIAAQGVARTLSLVRIQRCYRRLRRSLLHKLLRRYSTPSSRGGQVDLDATGLPGHVASDRVIRALSTVWLRAGSRRHRMPGARCELGVGSWLLWITSRLLLHGQRGTIVDGWSKVDVRQAIVVGRWGWSHAIWSSRRQGIADRLQDTGTRSLGRLAPVKGLGSSGAGVVRTGSRAEVIVVAACLAALCVLANHIPPRDGWRLSPVQHRVDLGQGRLVKRAGEATSARRGRRWFVGILTLQARGTLGQRLPVQRPAGPQVGQLLLRRWRRSSAEGCPSWLKGLIGRRRLDRRNTAISRRGGRIGCIWGCTCWMHGRCGIGRRGSSRWSG